MHLEKNYKKLPNLFFFKLLIIFDKKRCLFNNIYIFLDFLNVVKCQLFLQGCRKNDNPT